MSNEWGKALKKFRARTKLSQGQFCDEVSFLWMDLSETEFEELCEIVQADQLVLTNTTISRYEKGRRQPPQRRSQHLALIWALHKLKGIRTPAEANLWLQFADRAALTSEEQSTIFGDIGAVANGEYPANGNVLLDQPTFIWSSGSAVKIISSTAVILGALMLVIVGASLWRNFSADPNRPSTGGGAATQTPVTTSIVIPTVGDSALISGTHTTIPESILTDTPLAPTSTFLPSTDTPVPPTVVPMPPTNTSITLTNTPITLTNTPVPPTNSPEPSTSTPAPPTATQIPSQFQTGEIRSFSGINFAYVPRGPFVMGSSAQELEYPKGFCRDYGDIHCSQPTFDDELPQASIDVADFWIMQTEVTNDQFRAFVDGDGYTNRTYWTTEGWQWREANSIKAPSRWENPNFMGDMHPVAGVSWYEAMAYAKWLSQRTGINFRLPTEAEWEKAARGPNGLIFPWGDEWDPTRVNYCDANCDEEVKDNNSNDGFAFTAPVGQYESGKSPYNAYDMAGNLWEWTSTIYDIGLFPYPYKPDGREFLGGSHQRVWRGGAWYNLPYMLRTANHNGNSPDIRWAGVGFRLALSTE